MVVWGVDLALIIAGVSKLLKDKLGWTDEQVSWITASLTAFAVIFVAKVDELEILWPILAEWGPIVMSAIAAFLAVMGYMPTMLRMSRVWLRKRGFVN